VKKKECRWERWYERNGREVEGQETRGGRGRRRRRRCEEDKEGTYVTRCVLLPYRILPYENRDFPYVLRPTGYGTTPGWVTRQVEDVSVAEQRENNHSKTEVTMQLKLLLKR